MFLFSIVFQRSFYLLHLKNIPNFIFLKTSGIESDDHYQREQELQRENLKLSSENIELKFQLEQANKDLPRLKVNLIFFIIVTKSNAFFSLLNCYVYHVSLCRSQKLIFIKYHGSVILSTFAHLTVIC